MKFQSVFFKHIRKENILLLRLILGGINTPRDIREMRGVTNATVSESISIMKSKGMLIEKYVGESKKEKYYILTELGKGVIEFFNEYERLLEKHDKIFKKMEMFK